MPPNDVQIMADASLPDHAGAFYTAVLERLHEVLAPRNYLEIGTNAGVSLALARCPAIAIDPGFQVAMNVLSGKASCHMFQMGSDAFFARHDPTAFVGGKIEFAFLDGMHWFEFLLRDFIHVERHCRRNAVIAIHDCIPTDLFAARRESGDQTGRETARNPDWWAGDVWKAIRILRQYRPDLHIVALDAPPTGLILVTNLDPDNTTLHDGYFDIVEAARSEVDDAASLHDYFTSLGVAPTASLHTASQIAGRFWL